MRDLLRSMTFWWAIVFVAVFYLIGHLVPNRPLQEAERILEFAVALGAAIALAPNWWDSIRKRTSDLAVDDVLILAMGNLAGAISAAGLWQLLSRLSGQPAWMQNNDFVAFLVGVIIISFTMLMSVPGLVEGRVPPRSRLRVAIWWAMGAAIAAYVISERPDVAVYMEKIRPFLEEPDANTYGDREGRRARDLLKMEIPAIGQGLP